MATEPRVPVGVREVAASPPAPDGDATTGDTAVLGVDEPAFAGLDEVARRRLHREFQSVSKLRELRGEATDPEPQPDRPRLIVRSGGAALAPEPRPVRRAERPPRQAAAEEPPEPAEAVSRLEQAARPAAPRRSRDVAIEVVSSRRPDEDREDGWSGGRPRVSWRWSIAITVTMVTAVILALLVVQYLSVLHRDDGRRLTADVELEVERVDLGDAIDLLENSPRQLLVEAREALAGYAGAAGFEEALKWVRDPQGQRDLMSRRWKRWPAGPNFERTELIQYSFLNFQDPPCMVLWGMNRDYTPFRAYFVREDGRLKLDWQATEGFCDIPIPELAGADRAGAVTVRCVLEPKAFHTAALPESGYRSFLLSDAGGERFVWGYTERGGQVDRRLLEALDRDASLLEDKSRERVTLVLDWPGQRDLDSQFVITEMLHIEWVSP